ncbi:hypothetical protein BLGI_4255 [Brevibacillus laterosporus GI-9]|nr:hypothetical protein BLGI_4255 [Brevibacillus laterosporus GI-9]
MALPALILTKKTIFESYTFATSEKKVLDSLPYIIVEMNNKRNAFLLK